MEPVFEHVDGGYRFFLHHPAKLRKSGRRLGIVYVPPFAEEMNKCRHMASAAARRMAAQGVDVLIPDLAGCGDSVGEFADASIDDWLQDIDRAAQWLGDRTGAPIALWGVRFGALLAAHAAVAFPGRFQRCLFWQPVTSGEQMLTQFLRLKSASGIVSQQAAGASLADMRSALAEGGAVEVAGYWLTSSMAASLAQLRLTDLNPACRTNWIELSSDPARGLSAIASQIVEKWRQSGTQVEADTVPGAPFWNSGNNEDVVDCVGLLEATDDTVRKWQ